MKTDPHNLSYHNPITMYFREETQHYISCRFEDAQIDLLTTDSKCPLTLKLALALQILGAEITAIYPETFGIQTEDLNILSGPFPRISPLNYHTGKNQTKAKIAFIPAFLIVDQKYNWKKILSPYKTILYLNTVDHLQTISQIKLELRKSTIWNILQHYQIKNIIHDSPQFLITLKNPSPH